MGLPADVGGREGIGGQMDQSPELPFSVFCPSRVMSYNSNSTKDAGIRHMLRQRPSAGQGG